MKSIKLLLLMIMIILLDISFQTKGQSKNFIYKYFLRKENSKSIDFYIGNFNQDSVVIKFVKSEQAETNYFNSPKISVGNHLLQGDFNYSNIIMDSKSTKLVSNNKMLYILLRQKDFIDNDNFIVFSIKGKTIIADKRALYSKVTDVDNDGFMEVGGIHIIEAPCIECDSTYYNPVEIFELGESFHFDSTASKLLTIKEYGIFLGFQPLDTVLFYNFNHKKQNKPAHWNIQKP